MSELKPCPFCGCDLVTRHTGWLDHPKAKCILSGKVFHKGFIGQWNRRADLPPTLSAAMELPEVRAIVEAARKMLVAAELREIYHRLPNDKNRIGDPKSPKAKARDAWLKAFRRASSATSLALAAIKEPKT